MHLADATQAQGILKPPRFPRLGEPSAFEQIEQFRGSLRLARSRPRRLHARIEWRQIGTKAFEGESGGN